MLRSLFILTLLSTAPPTVCGGELYILTRAANSLSTGVVIPHAGAVVKYDDGSYQWLHFGVKDVQNDLKDALRRKWVAGEIRRNNFPINHLAGFSVPDDKLREAVKKIEQQFNGVNYRWGENGRDCVTFVTTLCKYAGLSVTRDGDYGTPIVMYYSICFRNKSDRTIKKTDLDSKPNFRPPWK